MAHLEHNVLFEDVLDGRYDVFHFALGKFDRLLRALEDLTITCKLLDAGQLIRVKRLRLRSRRLGGGRGSIRSGRGVARGRQERNLFCAPGSTLRFLSSLLLADARDGGDLERLLSGRSIGDVRNKL